MNDIQSIRFVRFAPRKCDRSKVVQIRISDMTYLDAVWWDSKIGPRQLSISGRADRYWSWSALLPVCHLTQLSKRRMCRPLVIWAQSDNGRFVRVGMSIIIQDYPYLDVSVKVNSHFVWFMCAADTRVLAKYFQMSDPPSLSRIHIDNAIVLSTNADFLGRIGLHAAVAGGAGLLNVYSKIPLISLPTSATLPKEIRRPNDGRFFYADETRAQNLIGMSDRYR